MTILRLAVPSPLRSLFDYLPPQDMGPEQAAALQPGVRLRVPFGKREVTGYLVECVNQTDVATEALKPALALLDETPVLDETLLELAAWATKYYHHPAGEVFSALFPRRLREGKTHDPVGEPGWQCTTRALGLGPDALARSPRQAEALQLLKNRGPVPGQTLKAAGISNAALRELAAKALAERCHITQVRDEPQARQGLSLNDEQQQAVDAITEALECFTCFLLEGVTGSGKTEVYLQAIAECLARGQQALVLIPEIGLTPQTLARFEARFEATIVVLHSGLTEAQRYRAWEQARSGQAHIVMGTRSAVFTPLANPGLIIVDEEHDASYKQQDGFRYLARDVAVKRAQLHTCPVVLGSATPSLESAFNAARGRYRHLALSQRATGAAQPAIQVLDVRRKALQAGLSEALTEAVAETLGRGEQALLFLNRRGFAPTLQCHDCGWIAQCGACDARLTVHRRHRQLRCHHCGHTTSLVPRCPECNSGSLMTQGLGTEQTEDWLRQRFTTHPIHRVDSDTMQGREAMQNLVEEINRGEPCILLGTQMLTKGHHFPRVSLVAVIDADALLFSADFRGEERMTQLLTQVAGRAGRADLAGKVIIQTHYPDHPLLTDFLDQSFGAMAAQMLTQREQAGLPPAGQLVLVRSDCRDARLAEDFLAELRNRIQQRLPAGTALIGPLPSPMQRRAGKFRAQLVLRAPTRATAQQSAALLVEIAESQRSRSDLKWSIDIDPQDMF